MLELFALGFFINLGVKSANDTYDSGKKLILGTGVTTLAHQAADKLTDAAHKVRDAATKKEEGDQKKAA